MSDTSEAKPAETEPMERRPSCPSGTVLGSLYGLAGPIGLAVIVGTSTNIFGRGEFLPGTSIVVQILWGLLFPSVLPVGLGLQAAEPTGALSLNDRGPEIAILLVANALFFAGFFGLIHGACSKQFGRLSESPVPGRQEPAKALVQQRWFFWPTVLGGLGLLILLVAPNVFQGVCHDRLMALRQQGATERKKKPPPQHTMQDLRDEMEVSIGNGKPFALAHKGNGVYQGRQNELVGSKIVECRYSFAADKSSVTITVEGSLLSPATVYRHEQLEHMTSGDYTARTNDGKELPFRITSDPFPFVIDIDWSPFIELLKALGGIGAP